VGATPPLQSSTGVGGDWEKTEENSELPEISRSRNWTSNGERRQTTSNHQVHTLGTVHGQQIGHVPRNIGMLSRPCSHSQAIATSSAPGCYPVQWTTKRLTGCAFVHPSLGLLFGSPLGFLPCAVARIGFSGTLGSTWPSFFP